MSGSASSIWRSRKGLQIATSCGVGVAVAGRAPGHHVGDIDVAAVEADGGEHAVEELAGAARRRACRRDPRRRPAPRRRTSGGRAGCRRRSTRFLAAELERAALEAGEQRLELGERSRRFAPARARPRRPRRGRRERQARGAAGSAPCQGSAAARPAAARAGRAGAGRAASAKRSCGASSRAQIDARLGIEIEQRFERGAIRGEVAHR